MIKQKPAVGSKVECAVKVKNIIGYSGLVYDMMEGVILEDNSPNFKIEIEDYLSGDKSIINIHISHIYIYEWGGVMIKNTKRDKTIFQGM